MSNFEYANMDNMYYCYSLKLFFYLKANGFYYVVKDKNPSSGKFFWAFKRTDELHDALKFYTEQKAINNNK